MTGYVFHCTPCGKAHAGDCPTKVKVSITVDPNSSKQAAEAIRSIGAAVQQISKLAPLPSFPPMGSRWLAECTTMRGWQQSGTGVYVVASWDFGGGAVYYYVEGYPQDVFKLPVEAWSTKGAEIANTGGTRVRFITQLATIAQSAVPVNGSAVP